MHCFSSRCSVTVKFKTLSGLIRSLSNFQLFSNFDDFLALRWQQYLNVSVRACRASSAGVAAGTASRCAVGGAVALHAQVKKDEGDSIPGRRREVGVIRHLGIPQRIIGIALWIEEL